MPGIETITQLFERLSTYPKIEIAIELLFTWLIVYAIWRFVRGTRAAGALKGILVVVVLFLALRLAAQGGSFERLSFLYDRFLGLAAIALVVIFQPELRRAVVRLGEAPFFRGAGVEVLPTVEAVTNACSFLSKNKFGAIIAIERQVGLREVLETGRLVDAAISADLIQAIFWPNSPLHDMGVVLRAGRVVAAGVQFPLADPTEMSDARLGTRHRAAIGLSRASDVLVVVVSEEGTDRRGGPAGGQEREESRQDGEQCSSSCRRETAT